MTRRNGARQKRDKRWRRAAALHDGWCNPCVKWAYATAKRASRALGDVHTRPSERPALLTYPCPFGRGWHYGHDQRRT